LERCGRIAGSKIDRKSSWNGAECWSARRTLRALGDQVEGRLRKSAEPFVITYLETAGCRQEVRDGVYEEKD
jgi:hypothetical protein